MKLTDNERKDDAMASRRQLLATIAATATTPVTAALATLAPVGRGDRSRSTDLRTTNRFAFHTGSGVTAHAGHGRIGSLRRAAIKATVAPGTPEGAPRRGPATPAGATRRESATPDDATRRGPGTPDGAIHETPGRPDEGTRGAPGTGRAWFAAVGLVGPAREVGTARLDRRAGGGHPAEGGLT
jgi:hypothetical protein